MENYETLYNKASKLEKEAKLAKNIAGNLFALAKMSDVDIRTISNNERFSFFAPDYFLAKNYCRVDGLYNVAIGLFARRGNDPLCQKIRSQFDPDSLFWVDESAEKLIAKLIARQLTETEYNNYLNGVWPVAVLNDEDYFLK